MSEKQKIIKVVYLSGSMEAVGSERGKSWRKRAEEILDEHGIDVFNPYRKPLCPPGTHQRPGVCRRQDLRIIDLSDALLVNASQTVICPHCGKDTGMGVEAHGTASECEYAAGKNIPIIAFIGNRKTFPRWLEEQAEFICKDLETACKYIINYNRRREGGDEGHPAEIDDYIDKEVKPTNEK